MRKRKRKRRENKSDKKKAEDSCLSFSPQRKHLQTVDLRSERVKFDGRKKKSYSR